MKIRIKIKKALKEMSSMGGGAVQGYVGSPLGTKEENDEFNEKEKQASKLKGKRLEERYSTQVTRGAGGGQVVDGEEEHAGHIERSQMQGLKNVMEVDDDADTLPLDNNEDIPTEIDEFKDIPPKAISAIKAAGYEPIKVLGGGQFGKVLKVKLPDGKEQAMKVVIASQQAQTREVRNYKLVQQARTQSENIAEHFPETFATWEQNGMSFIAMEILEPITNKSDVFIPDMVHIMSRDHRVDPDDPAFASRQDDQSKKAAAFYVNELIPSYRGVTKKFTNIFTHATRPVGPADPSEYTDLLRRLSSAQLSFLKGMYETRPEIFKQKQEEYFHFFMKSQDYPKTRAVLRQVSAETSGAPYFRTALGMLAKTYLDIRRKAWADIEQEWDQPAIEDTDNSMVAWLKNPIKGYREYSAIDLNYDPETIDVPEDSIKTSWAKTFKELKELTGLAGRDLHYGNIMQRPNGSLVIVDLGAFRKAKEGRIWGESKKYNLKILRN
jgi:hypothetical protein